LSGHGIYAAAELYPKYIDKIDSLPKRTVSIKKRYKREYLYGTETVHLDRERPVRLKTRENKKGRSPYMRKIYSAGTLWPRTPFPVR
jgi:hypothetical protein